MSKKILAIVCFWIFIGSSNANAYGIGGFYGNATNQGNNFRIGGAVYIEQNLPCTDSTYRKVPGEVINGKCHVEFGGKIYKNSTFKVLGYGRFGTPTLGSYPLIELTSGTKQFIINNGIVGGGELDLGYPAYHCFIDDINEGKEYWGKYIPAMNGCHFGVNGSARFIDMWDNRVILSVLTASYPTTTPPPGNPDPDPGTELY